MDKAELHGFRTVALPRVPDYEEPVMEAPEVELPRVLLQEIAGRKASRKLVFLTLLFVLLALVEGVLFKLHPPAPRVVVYHMLPADQEIQVNP